jgi:WD40 repeat protein
MADNIELSAGSGGAVVATDDDGVAQHQYVKVEFGADNTQTKVTASEGLPIQPDSTLTGGGTEDAALRVTIANNSTGVLSVDDGGGSLTIDGTVTANLGATDNAVLDFIAGSVAGTLVVDATGQGDVPVTLGGEAVVLGAGTAAIGKLAANSGVDIGDVDVTSAPARDRTTDNMGVALDSDTLMQDTTARTVSFGVINASSSGDNTLLAAQGASNKIRIVSLFLVSAGTVNVRFESAAGGTALTGQMPLIANTGFVLPFNPTGWFETGANALLNLELSGAIGVHGSFSYVVVT